MAQCAFYIFILLFFFLKFTSRSMRFIALDSEETFRTVRGMEVGLVSSRLASTSLHSLTYSQLTAIGQIGDGARINYVSKCWSNSVNPL